MRQSRACSPARPGPLRVTPDSTPENGSSPRTARQLPARPAGLPLTAGLAAPAHRQGKVTAPGPPRRPGNRLPIARFRGLCPALTPTRRQKFPLILETFRRAETFPVYFTKSLRPAESLRVNAGTTSVRGVVSRGCGGFLFGGAGLGFLLRPGLAGRDGWSGGLVPGMAGAALAGLRVPGRCGGWL